MMLRPQVSIPYNQIADFCERHHIIRFALFGSILSEQFHDDSDVDVLVEFDPKHIPGWEIVSMQDELSDIMGRKVDLNTYGSLSRHFRDKVLASTQVIYERKG